MKKNDSKAIKQLTFGAAIAAMYVVLTYLLAPISFGPIQFRISEALCILPVFTPAAIPGLAIGCLIANTLSGAVPMDIVFGSAATLIGAIGTYFLREHDVLSLLPPIIANALIVPWVLAYAYNVTDAIWFMIITVGAGELLAVGILGNILRKALRRYGSTMLLRIR